MANNGTGNRPPMFPPEESNEQLVERATKKRCLDPFGVANSSTNITHIHQQQQIETLQLELDHERSSHSLDNKMLQNKIKRLEKKISNLENDSEETKALNKESREQQERHVANLRESRDKMQRLNSHLQLQLEQTEHEVENLQSKSTECTRLEHELELLRAKVLSYDGMEAKFLADLAVLKEQLNQPKPASNPDPSSLDLPLNAKGSAEEPLLRELNRVRRELADTERANRQLTRKVDQLQRRNTELVQNTELYSQASKKLETTKLELLNVTRQYENLVAESKAWTDFAAQLSSVLDQSIVGPPEPATILRFLNDLKQSSQAANKDMLKCKGENRKLREQVVEYKNKAASQQEIVANYNQMSRDYESKISQLEEQLAISKQQGDLSQQESDGYRELIATFETQMVQKQTVDLSQATALRQKALSDQQTLLQTELDKNRTELDYQKSEKLKLAVELDRVREKFGKLRDALMEEREKVAQAQDRAVQAEQLSGKGSFDPSRTRVLHFSETPLVLSLKEEIQVLKRQIESTSKAPQSVAKGMAADPDKLNQRLKENFKEQIALFREGVYLMTGYKIDMLTNLERPTFRLRSVYAEREEDHLLLQWPKDEKVKSLDILNTDLAKVLSHSPSYDYMTKFHSLPAFLASVQLSLFENQTVMS